MKVCDVNFIVLIPKNPKDLISRCIIIFTTKGSNHLLSVIKEVWWIETSRVERRISHFARQTHHTASAPFTDSHSRSALFNIFRAVALTERRGRESHCCYGDEECVSGGWGAPWQKTRPDPTTPAPIGPELNADVFWQHDVLKPTFDSYLRLFTLIMSGSTQCPLQQLNAASVYTFRRWIQGAPK